MTSLSKSTRGRRGAQVIGSACAAIAVLLLVAVPSGATAPCADSSYVSRFDGIAENPTSSAYAARATITERNIALCSNALGATSGAAAWTMLAGADGVDGYAQIGYAELAPGSVTQRFWEYSPDSETWTRTMFANIVAGTTHTYSVVYSFTDGRVRMIFDGVTKATTPFSIEFGVWPTPWEGQWFGETLDRGDDMPGISTAKARFQSIGVVIQHGGGYVNPRNPQLPTLLPFYKFSWVTYPTTFEIWTQR